ncbi:MAG: phosphonopyruvate decarboxylase [Gammaproteobacteria bacterium]|nr:phosphonopyruvate decarboxylase [Gammaproteobacteria bacterium]MCP5201029.1 phosphonopyruvate decarboxylase [Gammaproteobacteria bacterium]
MNAPVADDWREALHESLKASGIDLVAYVPDAGHQRLIELAEADPAVAAVALTSEEEGIGLAAGAWLGGRRAVVLMQSSGVGNCVNAIASLSRACSLPLLLLVTMRGEWGEGNPWQVPMGQAVAPVLEALGVVVLRADAAADVLPVVEAAARMSFAGGPPVAVLIGQRVIGAKVFAR